MFLSQRATQAEYCDRPDLSSAEVASNYLQLARFNRLFLVADPFQRLLVRWLERPHVQRLSLLDLGAGDGWIGRTIEGWARRRGWEWQVTNLDCNLRALQLAGRPGSVAGNVCALPFQD